MQACRVYLEMIEHRIKKGRVMADKIKDINVAELLHLCTVLDDRELVKKILMRIIEISEDISTTKSDCKDEEPIAEVEPKICIQCSSKIVEARRNRFCSFHCSKDFWYAKRRKSLDKECVQCLAILPFGRRKFCSDRCCYEWHYIATGEKERLNNEAA